jgi:murein DD-endopeptidase MepM/ murein hydrolase activator NlpD
MYYILFFLDRMMFIRQMNTCVKEREIMFKRKLVTTFILGLLIANPSIILADEYDQKISEQDQKINSIKSETNAVEELINQTNQNISNLNSEINLILEEKNTKEQNVNELTVKIKELEEKIENRKVLIGKQARELQTSGKENNILAILLNAESVSDFVNQTISTSTLVNANNEIVKTQFEDMQNLDASKTELETELEQIAIKTDELKSKQEELIELQINQEVEIANLKIKLNKEEQEKESLIQEKEEAERKRQEALRAIEKQKEQEKLAREKAEQEEKERQIRLSQQVAQSEIKSEVSANTTNSNISETPKETITESPVENNTPAQSSNQQPQSSGGWRLPLDSINVSSGFGNRVDPTGSSGNQHNGIDMTGGVNTPIYAATSGEVVAASYDGSAGNHVIIRGSNGLYSYYLHMNSSPAVSVGQTVSQGTYLGGMGTTGNSTGVHLHFAISSGLWSGFQNPSSYLSF